MKSDDPAKQLASALGRITSGLYVLTVKRAQVETGMLASWVQQCSFQPPRISVAVNPERPISTLLQRQTDFTLNILETDQTDMIVHFGRGFALEEDAFNRVDVERGGPGGPILSEALAALECRVIDRSAAGDHDLIIAQIMAGRMLGDGQPMVHFRKSGFHY